MKFCSLKILTDENVSPQVVSFLRQREIDVIDTKEENWHGKDDEYLLKKAFLDSRFILTHDSDFGTLAVKEGKSYFGIIYLRLKIQKASNVIGVIEKLLSLDVELCQGNLIVVDDARIRIRLPESE